MRSLVVLFALVAVAVAAPYGGQFVVASPYQQVPVNYVVPSAVSHQSRFDYNGPVVSAEQVVASSPYATGLAPVPAFYAANPVYGGLPTHNYGGQVLAPFGAPGAVFAAY